MGKRGQVTLFVILGILIIVGGILIYIFFPGIKSTFSGASENPQIYLQNCLESEFEKNVELISLQGGDLNPQNYYLYKDSKVYYLCYAQDYYTSCVIQEPFLKDHVEDQLTKVMAPLVTTCLTSLKESYEKKGYKVSIVSANSNVKVLPEKTILNIPSSISLEKKESKTYDSFSIVLNNNLYEVLGVVRTIINYEALEGQIETTDLMSLYKNLKIEKLRQSEGTKIYKITDRETGDVFNVASRSQVLPPGFI